MARSACDLRFCALDMGWHGRRWHSHPRSGLTKACAVTGAVACHVPPHYSDEPRRDVVCAPTPDLRPDLVCFLARVAGADPGYSLGCAPPPAAWPP